MNFTREEKSAIKRGRKHFLAMATSYAFGAFNDNFFKQTTFLLAVAYSKDVLQGWATILFSVPFIIFAAWAGWFADRFPKRRIVVSAKLLELIAMGVGAFALITMNWWLMIAIVFLMGLQSTLFIPSLNGSIPELYPEKYVTNANAQLKLVTTIFILLGIASAGYALDYGRGKGDETGTVIVVALVVAFIGFLCSFGTVNTGKYNKKTKFPAAGPVNSVIDIKSYFQDKPLFLAMLMSTLFYFLSSLVLPLLNSYGLNELKYSTTNTSLMSVVLMVGVSIGAFIAAILTKKLPWTQVIAPSVSGFGAGLIMAAGATLCGDAVVYVLWSGLLLTGISGGVFLIPVTSFIQTRPAEGSKGRAISASNFLDFTGMLLAGQMFVSIEKWFKPSPSLTLMITGIVTMIVSIAIYRVVNSGIKVVVND